MKSTLKPVLLSIALISAFTSCNSPKNESENTELKGLDISNIDSTFKPTDDFYSYYSKKWEDKTEIPAEEKVWGPFIEVRSNNSKALKKIMEEVSTDTKAKEGSSRKKVGDFFASGMDSVKTNAAGFTPLKAEWEKTEAIKDKKDLIKRIAQLNKIGASAGFGFYVGQDDKKSTEMIVTFYQGGIGLPSKDYYDTKSEAMIAIQKEYKNHISKIYTMSGVDPKKAKQNADIVYSFEKKLADASMGKVELRNPELQYNKVAYNQLSKMYPAIDWTIYFEEYKTPSFDSLIVSQLQFMKNFDQLVATTPIDTWKIYLQWKLIDANAHYLSDDFVAENFNFFDKILLGAKAQKPRWKRVIEVLDHSMGDAIGEVYVERHFSAEAKQKISQMVEDIILVFKDRINKLDWMSEKTKVQAQKKLQTIVKKFGYPDKWKDYSKLNISRDSYVQNIMNSKEFAVQRMIDKLGKPVDRTEWGMSAPTVNAYYNPSKNEIVFPAGIMQPPFFNVEAPDYVNYASIGAAIGHELTHGFDDQGSQFDEMGNLKNWWTEEDKTKFKAKTKLIVDLYNSYVAVDTFHVNGQLTLGENIADLGGLTIAYYAWKRTPSGKNSTEKVNGYTKEQLFFMSFAQIWRLKMRDEALKNMVITNPHSPSKFRVIGTLSNMKEFYDAFGAKQGDKMYIEEKDRALIW